MIEGGGRYGERVFTRREREREGGREEERERGREGERESSGRKVGVREEGVRQGG